MKKYRCNMCGKIFYNDWRQLNGHKAMSHNSVARKHLSIAMTGKRLSAEHKRKISVASSKVVRTQAWKDRISFALSKNGENRHHKEISEETKKKISETMKRIANEDCFKENRRSKLIGQTKQNSEGRRIQATKISGDNNPAKRIEVRVKLRENNAMKNPIYLAKAIANSSKGNNIRPNKSEIKLLDTLNILYPFEWKYVGNGEVIIAGKCPDFINVNGKKLIIELFGDYWHKNDNPKNREKVFKPFGYRTLVVWEYELKNIKNLEQKIGNFINVL